MLGTEEETNELTAQDTSQFFQSRIDNVILVLYILVLAAVSFHLYRSPMYDMDAIQYMGNALLMESTDVARIHDRVYAELAQQVPRPALDALLGHEVGAPEDQNKSRQERAENPARFAEFLPLFAIRPLYNQTLYLVGRTGVGLVRAGVLISVASYFSIGLVLFFWVRRYVSGLFGLAGSLLMMISPPLLTLGRDPTSDAIATLVAFASLYLIFERKVLAPGLALLLVSLYFRTDFVVLAGPVLLACWLERRMRLWQAGALALLALMSVLFIQHFAGDYGIKMLYYRNFIGTPIAPGEMTVRFSFLDYLSAVRSGITKIAGSFFFPFLLLGIIGVRSQTRPLFWVALSYVVLHFLVLPNWEERWFGLFYLTMTCVACAGRPGALSHSYE